MSAVSVHINISGTVDLADLAKLAALVKPYEGESALNAVGAGANAAAPKQTSDKAAPKDKPAAAASNAKPEGKPKEAAVESADEKRAKATKLLQQINTANGIDAVRAALGEFGVANISAISDDKLDEVIAAFSDKIA